MRDKQANRRIRLLLVVFALVLRRDVRHARSGCRRCRLPGSRRSAAAGSSGTRARCRPAAARSSTAPGFSSRSASRRRRSTPTRQQVRNPRRSRSPPTTIFGVNANTLYPELLNKKQPVRLRRTLRGSDEGGAVPREAASSVSDSYPEEQPHLPAAHRRAAGDRLRRASTTRGLGGLELQYNSELSGRAGQADGDHGSARPRDRRDQLAARASRAQDVFSTIDHTIQAQAEQVLRQTVARVGGEGRARAIVLDPTTGEMLAMAQTPVYNDNDSNVVSGRCQRNRAGHRHLRAGLDLQARHDHRRALRGARDADDAASRCPTSSGTGPVSSARCTTPSIRPTETLSWRRSSPTPRTSAR